MARKDGLRSRAFFKLEQIDRRFRLLKPGGTAIDMGCAPGGWLQYASRTVGPRGFVLGIDLKPVDIVAGNVKTIVGDIGTPEISDMISQLVNGKADVVLTDLAPNVSGIWELDHVKQIDLTAHVVSLLPRLLREGGSVVMKVFQGAAFEPFLREVKQLFEDVSIVRPPATRAASSEVYLVGRGFKSQLPS